MAAEQQQQHPFLPSTHTIDEYKELQHKPEFSALEHAQWLMETVAQTTNRYVFKRRRGHSYWLEEVKADAIIKRMLNFNITVAQNSPAVYQGCWLLSFYVFTLTFSCEQLVLR